jgi:SAM-dependent methyltransferase
VEYQLVEATPLQKYVYDPNAKNLLQEYGKGKKVAVFHCASGHRARMAKEAGASEVLGLDTSFKQISLAREIELSKEDGIKYLVLNAYSKDFAEELPNEYKDGFDVVLGFFLIDHAQTKVELQTLAKNIYGNLKPGGMFIALLDDSEARVPTDPKYGVAIQPLEGRGDGSQRKIVIYQNMKDGEDRPVLHFFNFEWTRDTVQKIFNDVGFTTIFKDPFIVEEGKQNLGSEFWEKYEADPDNVLFICQK